MDGALATFIHKAHTYTTASNNKNRQAGALPQEANGDLGGHDLALLDVLVDHLRGGRLAIFLGGVGGVCKIGW